MISFYTKKRASLILLCGFLTACGGGGSGGSKSNQTGDPGSRGGSQSGTGYFIDAPVAGLTYYTSTPEGDQVTGETGPNGEFPLYEGRAISFAIGKLFLGQVTAQATVTPYSFMDSESSESLPLNMARLLQTLDDDENPDNGINISAAVRTAYNDTNKSFSDDYFSKADFELIAEDDLQYLLDRQDLKLVDATVAQAHLQATLANIDYRISLPGTRWRTELYPISLWYWHLDEERWKHGQSCTVEHYNLYRIDEYDASRVTTTRWDEFQWVPQCSKLGDEVAESPREYDALTLCGQKLGTDPNSNLTQCTYADLNSAVTYTTTDNVKFTVYSAHAMSSGVVYRTIYKEYDVDGISYREKWQSVTTQLLDN